MKVKSESEVTQSRPTLRNLMDCSPPGSSIHGIFQARVLEWVAIAFSENILLNNQYITEEIKQEIKKLLQINKNESTILQNLWDEAKSLLRGKFTAIKPYLKKQGKSQVIM